MSESIQFWAGFIVGLAVSVLGITIGISQEAKKSTGRYVFCIIALGGVLMIGSTKLWRNPAMPFFQAIAILSLLLVVSFAIIGLVIFRYPEDEGERNA